MQPDNNIPIIIGHRANTLNDIYRYYYKHDLRMIELDVNLTQDKKIAVYHDDVSMKRMKHLLRDNILVLDNVLSNIPSDLTINIEIKRYESIQAKQNRLPNDIITKIIMAVKKRNKKNVLYSSFDREIVRITLKNKRDGMLLLKEDSNLEDLEGYPHICIEKSLLDRLNSIKLYEKKIIYVYDVKADELEILKAKYPFIKGWIVDF
jgi:glycerophosphoryl diester phosphodiesterase